MGDKRKAPPYSGIEDADTEQEFRRDTRPTDPPIPLVHRRPSALPEDEVLPPLLPSDLLASNADIRPRPVPASGQGPTEPDVRLPSEMDTIETSRLEELEPNTVEVARAVEPTLESGFELGEIASLPPMPEPRTKPRLGTGLILGLLLATGVVAGIATTLLKPASEQPDEEKNEPIAAATFAPTPAPDPPVAQIPVPKPPPNPEDLVVIVNTRSAVTELDEKTIKKLYLEDRTFDDGSPARVVGRYKDPELRKRFLDKVLGVSHDDIKAIWATGPIERYRRLPTDEAVIEWVAKRKGGVGYIQRGSLPQGETRVRIAYEETNAE